MRNSGQDRQYHFEEVLDMVLLVIMTIAEIGGTMPERLETPENISKVKSRIKKEEKKLLE